MADLCSHLYCPHLHFKKCRRQRERKIPYTTRPTKDIDLTCNVHQKMINLTNTNIPTLAYQHYSLTQATPAQDEMNFSKNYYLENCPENVQMRNTLIADQEASLAQHNAYVLAVDATKEYDVFAKRRKEYLKNAQTRAKMSYHHYFQAKKEEAERLKEEQSKWVTDYYRKVQELIQHIYGKENQNVDPNLQDKLFIKENQTKNAKFFAGVKVSNPAVAFEILQSLRALLLRKKISLQEERKDQQHKNKNATASYMDASQSQSQDVTQGSFMSAATNATQQPGQSHFAEQFCDFPSMEQRWGVRDVTEIRNIIRRLLSKNMIIRAEGKEMRDRKAAKEKNELLRKQMNEMMGKSATAAVKNKVEKKCASKTGKKPQTERAKTTDTHSTAKQPVEQLPMFRQSLTSQDQQIKTSILKGGIYDSVGDKYQRNRKYIPLYHSFSQLFKRKKEESTFQLSFREEAQFYRPAHTTRK